MAVTKDQFVWEGDTLIHVFTGARVDATTGRVDWPGSTGLWDSGEFHPFDVGFVAGQLLARRTASADLVPGQNEAFDDEPGSAQVGQVSANRCHMPNP